MSTRSLHLVVAVLAGLLGLCPHAAGAEYNESACPTWIGEYANFHNRTKGTPAAQYIGYSCNRGGECAGAGGQTSSDPRRWMFDHMSLEVAAIFVSNDAQTTPNLLPAAAAGFSCQRHVKQIMSPPYHAFHPLFQPRAIAPGPISVAGDRFRGLLFTLRMAAATQRVLLLDWSHPVPVTEFLIPSKIDWRITPDIQSGLANEKYFHWGLPGPPMPAEVGRPLAQARPLKLQFILPQLPDACCPDRIHTNANANANQTNRQKHQHTNARFHTRLRTTRLSNGCSYHPAACSSPPRRHSTAPPVA
jgi:hypothetical protein